MPKNFGDDLRALMKKYHITSIESPYDSFSSIYLNDATGELHVQGFRFEGEELKVSEILGECSYLSFKFKDKN